MPHSGRTTIVIDPITHRKAMQLAKEANMTLGAFIGHVLNGAVNEIASIVQDSRNNTEAVQKLEAIRKIVNS